MRVIALSIAALMLSSEASPRDAGAEIVDLFASMAAALSDGNAAAFMKGMDPGMPDYERIKMQVAALLHNGDVSNAIEPLKNDGDDSRRSVDLDWYLDIRSRVPGGPYTTRRDVIHCQVNKQGKRWRVVSLKPAGFFDAPKQ